MKFDFITPEISKTSDSLFKSIVENMGSGVFVVDENYKFIYANPSFCEMFLRDKASIIGTDISDYILDSNKDSFDVKLRMISKGINDPFDINFEVGVSSRLFSLSPKSDFNDKNNFAGFFAVVKDITEDRSVHSSMSISDDILEEIGTLFIVGNSLGEILYCAPSVKQILGYDSGEMLKNGWYTKTFLNDFEVDEAIKVYRKTAISSKNELTSQFYEREILCANGDKKWILWQDNPGPVGLFISVGYDITERKKTELKLIHSEQALQKKNNELDTFVYKASHDLKGPLASIIGLTNVALSDQSSERTEIIKMIKTSTERLNNILDDLLRISRITHGSVTKTMINVYDSISEIIDSLKHAELAKGISVNVIGDHHLTFNTDKNFFKSIFQNLVSNAVKFSDSKKDFKLINLEFHIEDSFLIVKVIDNGLGIPIDVKTSVFDMFYRVNNTNVEGTGLGLYIVKSTLDKLHGSISYESTPNIGTSFLIKIPI